MVSPLNRLLARQFARPSGVLGRLLIAPWLNRMSRADNALALARLQPVQGRDVLELGFGGGALLRMALQAGARSVTGVDVAADMVARAERGFADEIHAGRAHVKRSDGGAIPVAADAVDAAVSLHNIYFWPDQAAMLAELRRVLRPGGRLVLGFEPAAQMRQWPGHEHGFQLQRAEAVAEAVGRAGFMDVRAETIEKSVDVCFVTATST
ncbi:MAG: class I SAM-dependent methyltransferase [Pacificimonas sp.]|jgi:SAM-dependent methyltransferase|nr:class I SAM-dependent methyltransferase [Pacificimonas sp.]